MILPRGYDAAQAYPVIVMFPASGVTAEALYMSYPPRTDAIVVLSAGTGTLGDVSTTDAWMRTLARYETQLKADLATLARVDITRVVLAGFCLGGDIAWALALRNADTVRGAVVMSSRASYRGRLTDMRLLSANGARFFLTVGDAETQSRRMGARAAAQLLDSLEIRNRHEEIPGGGHARPPESVWLSGIGYVLGNGHARPARDVA